jgi:hypothetical protein
MLSHSVPLMETYMGENINVALAPLKNVLAANDKVPLIPEAALEQQFHGLSLRQLVQLTAAPALAVVSNGQAPDGSQRERFAIDGNDQQKCGMIARQLLLGAATPSQPGDIREVRLSGEEGLEQTLVRDHRDVVYRIVDGQSAVDQQLTDLLGRRRSLAADRHAAHTFSTADDGRPVVPALAEILEASTTLRTANGATAQAIEELVAASGQPDLATAIRAADPEGLAAAFEQILTASTQVDRLARGIASQLDAVLRLFRSDSRGGQQPHEVGGAPEFLMPSERPDQSDIVPYPHEPF